MNRLIKMTLFRKFVVENNYRNKRCNNLLTKHYKQTKKIQKTNFLARYILKDRLLS